LWWRRRVGHYRNLHQPAKNRAANLRTNLTTGI
jgi:hypothetical protein